MNTENKTETQVSLAKTKTYWKAVYRCKDCGEYFEKGGDFDEDSEAITQVGSDTVEINKRANSRRRVTLPMMTLHGHEKGSGLAELIYFDDCIKA